MADRIPGSSYDNPLWYRGYRIFTGPYPEHGFAYEFVHEEYDGAEDSDDNRAGHAPSLEVCHLLIDVIEDERCTANG